MTTITVIVDKEKKPQYKDYVQFLGTYKSGKKSESENNNYSTSSLGDDSDINEMPTKSFSEYLNDYNNKKYQPVHPDFVKKKEEPKNVKTEVFLQINNTNNDIKCNNEHQIKITVPKPIINELDGEEIKVSVGKLSQKFKSNNNNSQASPTNFLKRSSSITEKTKIFEEKSEENISTITKINKTNYNEKFPKKLEAPVKKSSGNRLNQTFVKIRQQELQNGPKLNGTGTTIVPHLPPVKTEVTATLNLPNSNTIPNNSSEIKIEHNSTSGRETDASSNFIAKEIEATQERIVKIETKDASCPMPPPPPPLPPTNLPPKHVTSKIPNSSPKPFNTISSQPLPRPQNGYSTLPKMQSNKNDTTDGTTIDKNDPRVKKMVYGALRGMYGAYHDKANDYLATLPKNRVKKGNGLDSIIDSIAAQGGLDKLCGRANPKTETDQIPTNI